MPGYLGLQAEKGDVLRPLLDGDVPESRALYLALEQCLFHRIRTKDFGGKLGGRGF